MRTFYLKPEHVMLLRKANVCWDDCETGAPAINPKRPYGNQFVAMDVAEILGYGAAMDLSEGLSEDTEVELLELHKETETALQVILSAGSFKPGVYEEVGYRQWRPKTR